MPAPRLHPFARLVICGVAMFVAMIVASICIIPFAALGLKLFHLPIPTDQKQIMAKYGLLLTIVTYPFLLGAMALCRIHLDLRSWASLGLRKTRLASNFARGALTGFFSIGLLWALLWLLGAVVVNGWSEQAMAGGIGGSFFWLLLYGVAFCCVGFFEEVVFRGYLLQNLNAWMGWIGALIAQAVLFALIHLGNVSKEGLMSAIGALPSLALIAVFFALSWRKTGSLWFPIGFHAAWNFSLGCLFSSAVSGIETFHLLDVEVNAASPLSGGAFGLEGSWLLPAIILVQIYFLAKAPDHPQALLDLQLLKGALTQPPTVPVYAVAAPHTAIPAAEMEEEEEERENRFKSRFGGAQGFDSQMLRELREMQEQREKVAQEALQAQRDAERQLRQQEQAQRELLPLNTSNEAAMETALAATAATPRAEATALEVTPITAAPASESATSAATEVSAEPTPAMAEKRPEPQVTAPVAPRPTPVEMATPAPVASERPQAPVTTEPPVSTPTTETPEPPVVPKKKNVQRW